MSFFRVYSFSFPIRLPNLKVAVATIHVISSGNVVVVSIIRSPLLIREHMEERALDLAVSVHPNIKKVCIFPLPFIP